MAELDKVTNKVALRTTRDMHVLNTNFTAVSFLHGGDNFSEGPLALLPAHNTAPLRQTDEEFAVHVSLSEAIERRVEKLQHLLSGLLELRGNLIFVDFCQIERVNVSLVMTMSHVSANESENLETILLSLNHITGCT